VKNDNKVPINCPHFIFLGNFLAKKGPDFANLGKIKKFLKNAYKRIILYETNLE